MKDQKLENVEAIICLMMISITNIVLISSRVIIKTTDSASLLNSIYLSVIAIIISLSFGFLLKKFNGQDLIQIAYFLGKTPLKLFIGMSFSIYFLLRIGIFLKKMSDAMQVIYYPLTNIVFIIALFCIACGIIAYLGNNSLFKTMVLISPVLYLPVFFIFVGNIKNFDFANIYPLFGNGIKDTFISGLSNLFSFTGLVYLFFLPSKLKFPEKIVKVSFISAIIYGIYMIFCIASIIFVFSDILHTSELPPLYISVRYIEFGTFFQRLDAAFIFLCVLGFICALNINLYFVLDILKQITNTSNTKIFIFPCLLISLGIALSINKTSTLEFLEESLSKILFFIFAIIIPFVLLILGIIKKKIIQKNLN